MVTPVRRAPWSPRAWRQAVYLAGGIPAQLAVMLPLVAWVLDRYHLRWVQGVPVRWGKAWPFLLIGLAIAFLALPLLTRMHRHRLRTTAGVDIPLQAPMAIRWSLAGLAGYVRSPATRRQLGYHALAAPALAAAAIVALGAWLAGCSSRWSTPTHGRCPTGTSSATARRIRRQMQSSAFPGTCT